MSQRDILIHPDPRLRKTAEDVTVFDADLAALVADMFETMYEAPGIGLAATQVGVMQQIFVMDCAGQDEEPRPIAMINPRILWSSEETETSEEGCLSIPEIYGDVTRPERVRVAWLDVAGAAQEREFGGREAVCIQHEMDHLAGKLFIDYLSPVRRTMITAKMKKLKRERSRV